MRNKIIFGLKSMEDEEDLGEHGEEWIYFAHKEG